MMDTGCTGGTMNRQRIKDELLSFVEVLSDDQLQRLLTIVRNENWDALSHRLHARKALSPARDITGEGEQPFAIKNISLGGAFVETQRCLSIGQAITLEMTFNSDGEPLVLPGTVVRANAYGFGIQFLCDDHQMIQALNRKLGL